jgi:hypothetical protein
MLCGGSFMHFCKFFEDRPLSGREFNRSLRDHNSVDRFVIAIQTTASRFRSTKDGNDATLVFR